MLPPDEIRALLREHDDPSRRERPRDFDFDLEVAAHRFARLTAALEERFAPSGSSGLYQDASAYGVFSVSPQDTGAGTDADGGLWVELSNFGGFVTAGTGRDWSEPGAADGLSRAFVTWLDELCTGAGCVLVPLRILLEPYEGPTPTLADDDRIFLEALAAAGYDDADDEEVTPPVWADRYFQWV